MSTTPPTQQPEARISPGPTPTLDDAPRIAEDCKLIVARFWDFIMNPPDRRAQESRSNAQLAEDAERITTQVISLLDMIKKGTQVHYRNMRPDITVKHLARSVERIPGRGADPIAFETRPDGKLRIDRDVAAFADRLKAVAVSFAELERNPHKPGDDIQVTLDRIHHILYEVGVVQPLLEVALRCITQALWEDLRWSTMQEITLFG